MMGKDLGIKEHLLFHYHYNIIPLDNLSFFSFNFWIFTAAHSYGTNLSNV